MTISKDDADKLACELVSLSMEIKEKQDKIKELKAQLLEYAEANGIEGVDSSMLKADIYEVIVNNM
jgi:cell division FtsZ-interacting protein ZapD